MDVVYILTFGIVAERLKLSFVAIVQTYLIISLACVREAYF